MNNSDTNYRNLLIETTNYLIETRHNLFGNALNIAMANELDDVNKVFAEGDTYNFQIEHLDNSNDENLQQLVDLIRKIEATVDFITNVNSIDDSELDNERS
jgi:hypothetical protein